MDITEEQRINYMMSADTRMTLKILYSLDNGAAGSYLARSKTPHLVKVLNIPDPNAVPVGRMVTEGDGMAMLRVGAVHISSVLQEIYNNSPEVLSALDSGCGQDYNLYYRDICETDEPLVSLGLLSHIRKTVDSDKKELAGNDADEDLDEDFVVTGRVCSNLSALLRRSYSGMSKKVSSTPQETLEVKLRFTKIYNTASLKPDNEVKVRRVTKEPSLPQPKVVETTPIVNQPKQVINRNKGRVVTKHVQQMNAPPLGAANVNTNRRQTNPMPAPKAKRTQSLPIWNLKPGGSNNSYLKNSIAHKIYMADRQLDNSSNTTTVSNSVAEHESKPTDDDKVSKRFDFMLSKKKGNSGNKNVTKKSSSNSKKTTEKDNQSQNKSVKKAKAKTTEFRKPSLSINQDFNLPYPNLLGETTPQADLFINNKINDDINDKENIPPHSDSDNYDISSELDMIAFDNMTMKGDMNWLNTYDAFEYQNAHLNLQNSKGFNSTPQDANTCNTVNIENDDDDEISAGTRMDDVNINSDGYRSKSSAYAQTDIDKTSPIDNMSGSAITNLNRNSADVDKKDKNKMVLNIEVDDDDDEDDNMNANTTSAAAMNSTPIEQSSIRKVSTTRRSISTIQEEDQDEADEDKRMSKKRKTIPSSPSMMFSYHDGSPSSEITNELFTSFINNGIEGEEDNQDTPATICPSSDPAIGQKETPLV
ncbi:Hypothetical protein J6898_00829 [Nakaseomyces glabratus]